MKKFHIYVTALAILAISAFTLKISPKSSAVDSANIDKGVYTVDTDASEVKWEGKKIAYGHYGTVKIASGSLDFDADGLAGGKFNLDMTTIKNDDIEDAEKNAKLIGHLKSDDFFSVENHPVSTFVITQTEALDDDMYEITGDLTIKGITHPVTFEAEVKEGNGVVSANASMTFDRSKYDVKFQSGSFFENLGDKAIYDDIEMEVMLVAKKGDGLVNK